jgi:hypothetical protein
MKQKRDRTKKHKQQNNHPLINEGYAIMGHKHVLRLWRLGSRVRSEGLVTSTFCRGATLKRYECINDSIVR